MSKQHKWHKEIKAWADGEEIEYRDPYDGLSWLPATTPSWRDSDGSIEYRIKPKPNYVPYNFSDAEFLLGRSVKYIGGNNIYLLTGITDDGVWISTTKHSYTQFLAHFTMDGKPCGKLK